MSSVWSVEISEAAKRHLRSQDAPVRNRVLKFLHVRVANLQGARLIGKAMKGHEYAGFWLYRVGDYRLIRQLNNDTRVVTLTYIDHRKQVYNRIRF